MPAHHLHARHARLHPDHAVAALDERAAMPEPEADPDVKTVISVVYYTAPKTFDGPAIYVTDSLNYPSETESVSAAQNTAEATQSSTDDDEPTSTASTKATAKSTGTTLATQTVKPSKTAEESSSSASSQITSTADLSSSLKLSQATAVSSATAIASASASSSSTAAASSSSSDSGMSGGAKAGMAFAIICFIALVVFLAFFWKKKQQEKNRVAPENEKYDEKRVPPQAENPFNDPSDRAAGNPAPIGGIVAMSNNSTNSVNSGRPATTASRAPSVRTVKTAGNAPRLSLRPMTQFNPMSNQKGEGDILDTPVGVSPWEKRGAANAASDPANPFGNHAETVDTATARDAVELGTPTTPMTPALEFPFPVKIAPTSAPTSAPMSAPIPGAAMTTEKAVPPPPVALRHGSTSGVPKHISIASDMSGSTAVGGVQNPNPFADKDVPPSPGPAPTGPVPVPGGAPGANGTNYVVHRCQMDFTPSMSDELGVKNGQLVRIMHEYDDGWALCQKMDGSQQGVVPRSCLSKQPLKPRPGPPPAGARSPMGPTQGPPRARRPSNASSNGVPILGQPRPLSPATGRNSPGPQGPPQGRPRAGSNASFAGQPRPMSPSGGRSSPGPRSMSPMNPAGPRQRSQSNASFNAPRPQFAQEAQRPRANSTGTAGRGTPPGPSPLAPAPAPGAGANAAVPQRKPVPGQAL